MSTDYVESRTEVRHRRDCADTFRSGENPRQSFRNCTTGLQRTCTTTCVSRETSKEHQTPKDARSFTRSWKSLTLLLVAFHQTCSPPNSLIEPNRAGTMCLGIFSGSRKGHLLREQVGASFPMNLKCLLTTICAWTGTVCGFSPAKQKLHFTITDFILWIFSNQSRYEHPPLQISRRKRFGIGRVVISWLFPM